MPTKHNNTSAGSLLIDHQFHFQSLNDNELLRTTGSWIYWSSDRLMDKLDMYKDILESPDKNDPSKYMHETRSESKYSSIRKCKLFKNAAKQKGFSLLHCNMRSLGKNVSLLHDILLTVETQSKRQKSIKILVLISTYLDTTLLIQIQNHVPEVLVCILLTN